MSAGHFLAVLDDDVFTYVFDRIPCQDVAFKPCDGSQRSTLLSLIVHLQCRQLIVGHHDLDIHLSFGLLGVYERLLLLTVHLEALYLVAVAADGDIEVGVTVLETFERACSGEGLRHKGMESESILLEVDSEKHLMGEGDVAAETPEHVGGVQLGGDIAVLDIEVLLVGSEEGGRTEYTSYGLHHAFLISGLGVGETPPRSYPWPKRLIVVGRNVGDGGIEYGSTERSGRIILGD